MPRRSTIWGDAPLPMQMPIKGCRYIYALLDPFDFKARWVGQTYNPKQRLNNHMSEIYGNYPKPAWMRGLRDRQERPVFITLAVCDTDSAIVQERIWIRLLEDQGHPLFNKIYKPVKA